MTANPGLMLLAYAIIFCGCIIQLTGFVRFLVVTRRVGTGWFLACAFCVLCWPFFLAAHFSQAKKPFAVWLAGIILSAIGMLILDFLPAKGHGFIHYSNLR